MIDKVCETIAYECVHADLALQMVSKEYRNELRDFMVNELKVDKAMALDGGLSTAINYKNISIGSLGKYQRKVKSFLVVER